MHNFYANEVEAEFQRQEWQRRAAAHERAAQAGSASWNIHLPHLPHLSLASLRALIVPRASLAGPLATCHSPQLVEC